MAGVSLVQYRRKQGNDQQRLVEAQALKTLCSRFGALFIINDRIDLALLVDADGVHLGQDDLPLSEARQLLGPGALTGTAAPTAWSTCSRPSKRAPTIWALAPSSPPPPNAIAAQPA